VTDSVSRFENREIGSSLSTSSGPAKPPDFKFEREDWTLFRTIEGLQQKAGVPANKLQRLVLKELADNALDVGGDARVGYLGGGRYYVEDKGPGIDGTPEEIARLFSIRRPMVSAKLWRMPTRGALGNGLRVVSGAVLASSGTLVVLTRNQRLELTPQHDGNTIVVASEIDFPTGTRIEISLGPAIPDDADALLWAKQACEMARGDCYRGKSSPWWYDGSHFHELLRAAPPELHVRELVARLDGCAEPKAGRIAAEFRGMRCNALTQQESDRLLATARREARPVKPERLGAAEFGFDEDGRALDYFVAREYGNVEIGIDPAAMIPFAVEVWVRQLRSSNEGNNDFQVFVNRTPVATETDAYRQKTKLAFFGCGLAIAVTAPKGSYEILLNVTTPYMPITSDGKEPDLTRFQSAVVAALAKALRRARRSAPADQAVSQKDVVLANLQAAIAKVSGGHAHRFNQRQVLYALRPVIMEKTGQDLSTNYFGAIITDYEAEAGDIPGMYREPRGSIYHPHTGETIPLGTLMVEAYNRPFWTFNKLLYIEKEGFSEMLKAVRWPERHDCALASSKGFTTRAIRDLVDKLAEHDEPITVFCVHDADAAGTMIFQTFQKATKARGARKVKIVNLGLEPWEAIQLGLEVERVKEGDKRKAVADYVVDAEEDLDGEAYWAEWLQTHRVELNAMTTPHFIQWLDTKMAKHGDGKLIPPPGVIEAELDRDIQEKLREGLTARILWDAAIDKQVSAALATIKKPDSPELVKGIKRSFQECSDGAWRDHIDEVGTELAEAALSSGES
jgi:hypothetical protein